MLGRLVKVILLGALALASLITLMAIGWDGIGVILRNLFLGSIVLCIVLYAIFGILKVIEYIIFGKKRLTTL